MWNYKRKADVHRGIVANRIIGCIPTLEKLGIFWKKSKCNLKWKLNVFNAVILTKLAYGLETVQLTERVWKKLDIFK